jgi:predicted acyl esterase
MQVSISGKRSNYVFSWRIINETNEYSRPLVGNTVNKFSIKLFDNKTSFSPDDTLRISFNDYTLIEDLNGNLLVNQSFAERNTPEFIYISADEANAVGAGGESMKYAFLSALGFQLGLKVIINGSM